MRLLKNALIEPAKHPQKVCTSWMVKEVGLVSKESAPAPPKGFRVWERGADSICFVC